MYEILADGLQWTLRGGRNRVPAFGIDGGGPGRLGRCVRNPRTPEETVLPSRFSNVALNTGDLAAIEKPGGGGLGDPAEAACSRRSSTTCSTATSRAPRR